MSRRGKTKNSYLRWLAGVGLIASTAGCIGCKSESAPVKQEVAAASASPSASGISLKVNGKPQAVRSALAYGVSPSTIDLLLTTDEVACSDPRARQKIGTTTDSLRVRLAAGLDRDGKISWRVSEAAFDGAVHSGNVATAQVTRVEGEDEVRARFSVRLHGASPADQPDKSLSFDGEVRAKECGTIPTAGGPVRAQPELQFEVAGKRLEVSGASLTRTKAGIELRLSTAPHDCSTEALEGDAVLKLTIAGKPPEIKSAFLRGELFESQLTGPALTREELAIEPFKLPKQPQDTKVTLKGKFDLVGYAVRLEGTVTALVCE